MKLKLEETMPFPMPARGVSESEPDLTLHESVLNIVRGCLGRNSTAAGSVGRRHTSSRSEGTSRYHLLNLN